MSTTRRNFIKGGLVGGILAGLGALALPAAQAFQQFPSSQVLRIDDRKFKAWRLRMWLQWSGEAHCADEFAHLVQQIMAQKPAMGEFARELHLQDCQRALDKYHRHRARWTQQKQSELKVADFTQVLKELRTRGEV